MGDVGSAFLGFSFGVMPLLHSSSSNLVPRDLPLIAILMLWPFVFDSVVTLVRRALKRQPVWKPHREHIYQRLVIAGYEHKFVSKMYIGFASVVVVLVYLNVRVDGTLTPLVLLSAVILSAALFAFGQRKRELV